MKSDQCNGLDTLAVDHDRIYADNGRTSPNRDRPGLRLALAACRAGDTLAVIPLSPIGSNRLVVAWHQKGAVELRW